MPALVELDPETLRFSLDDTGEAVVAVPLSAISGAVVRDEVLTLTMRDRPGQKVQDIGKQVAVRAKDRVRIVKMDAEAKQ